jgi:(1->4)-alpha-D-glucan 1-alpha-D-glucosylmutase
MKIPIATYRLQFNAQFDFEKASNLLDYFSALGISDIYASPIFKSRSGSTHGYDVVDPSQIDPELGGAEGFDTLAQNVQVKGLGWIQDIVPNHMAYDSDNVMLMDIMEHKQNSKYAKFFDIDWNHHFEDLKGKILAPFLGTFYAEALQNAEIQLHYDQNGFSIHYYNFILPLYLKSYGTVLRRNILALESNLGHDHPDLKKFYDILTAFEKIADGQDVHFQYEHTKEAKESLWQLYQTNDQIKKHIDQNIQLYNGNKGVMESFNDLDALMTEQAFRLSFWKVSIGEINYRRFFSINDLISVRVEDNDVFNFTHETLFKLIKDGKITGLRIDHIDGLYDPHSYLKRLREVVGDMYVVVEKILDLEERLPSVWPVQGTTGYDFTDYVNGLFCKGEAEKDFTKLYYKFTNLHTSYDDLVYKNKLLIVRNMAGTIQNLAYLMKKIAAKDRYGRDITFYELQRALVEFIVNFSVYRTYINHDDFSEADKDYIKRALIKSQERMPGLAYEMNFIAKFFDRDAMAFLPIEEKRDFIDFVMKLQQLTAPLMAKGFEDTVLYVYNKLISLNEVGGNPNRFGVTRKDFDRFIQTRRETFPQSMNATSTHDTKKGEDVRARINVLSEIPYEWNAQLKAWSKLNLLKIHHTGEKYAPDKNDEYALYQILLGSFPFDSNDLSAYRERIKQYLIKAVREAKVHTNWFKPDQVYEQGCLNFVDQLLSDEKDNAFLNSFLPFQRKIAFFGIFNSLSQTLLKMTAPGMPDFYQGSELWDLNLVDPDNRRPVDFDLRQTFLQDIIKKERDTGALIQELLSAKEDGRIKLFLIYKVLKVRREFSVLFQKGTYKPLSIEGKWKRHVVAFIREDKKTKALMIVPRFLTRFLKEGDMPVGDIWQDTAVVCPKDAIWRNVITDEDITVKNKMPLSQAFAQFPAAVFLSSH